MNLCISAVCFFTYCYLQVLPKWTIIINAKTVLEKKTFSDDISFQHLTLLNRNWNNTVKSVLTEILLFCCCFLLLFIAHYSYFGAAHFFSLSLSLFLNSCAVSLSGSPQLLLLLLLLFNFVILSQRHQDQRSTGINVPTKARRERK